MKSLKVKRHSFRESCLTKQRRTTVFLKSVMAIGLGLILVFGNTGFGLLSGNIVYADEDLNFSADAYENHWGRSDLRAWLNGLSKTDNNLPIDGSNGAKGGEGNKNFLDSFTNAELALFQPKWVTTTMYNDHSQTGTISEFKTKDKFWLPTGNYNSDQLLSADPSYDLSDNNTYIQKVRNGKANNWENIIPTPMWIVGTNTACLRSGLHTKYYVENILLSARFARPNARYYYVFNGDITTNDYYACACAYMSFPSDYFTATASASANQTGQNFSDSEISAYDNLGKKDFVGAPSWGMHLKQISLSSINGTLNYNNSQNSLSFTTDSEIPKDKYLMVQAYKAWDSTKTPTENASGGDMVYLAGKKIENDSTTSVTFENAPDLSGYTVKVWVEEKETENSLAKASSPLTFLVNGTGTADRVTESRSTNPRVFANKGDLSCSWGTYENETDSTILEEGKSGIYVGENATWQKLYIGTGENHEPIEWWIASSDNGGLTLYQASNNTGEHQFNSSADKYTGTKRNPSLSLSNDLTVEDLENIGSKVTLKASKDSEEPLNASADKFSVQYCKAAKVNQNQFSMSGFEWTDSPTGSGDYYVRAVFSGETIDGVDYAPCISAKQLVKDVIFETEVSVTWEEPSSYVYSGSEIKPVVTSVINGDSSVPAGMTVKYQKYEDGQWKDLTDAPSTAPGNYKMVIGSGDEDIETKYFKILEADTDFTVSYYAKDEETGTWSTDPVDPVNAGAYKAVVTFTDTGHDQTEKEFRINPKSISSATVILSPDTAGYTGGEITPEVTVKDGDKTLSLVDYNVSYGDNVNASQNAKVTVTGKGNYKDSAEKTFVINPASVTLTANSRDTDVYDGTEKTVTGFTSSVDGLTFEDVNASGSGTEAGSYDVTFSGVTINETKDSTGNYVVTATESGKLTIKQATPGTSVAAEDTDYGQKAAVTFTAPADAKGKVTFRLDGAETGVTKDIENGQAVCEFENLGIGSHTVECVYTGDGNYTSGETKTANFEVKSINCPLTVYYQYEDGTEAAETYTGSVAIFTDYSVASPAITGYTPDTATVEGTMGDEDMDGRTVTVKYTAIPSEENPEEPAEDTPDEPAEETPVEPAEETPVEPAAPVAVEGNRSGNVGYKENQTFTADVANLPEGAEIHWFVNGEDVGTGSEYTVIGPKDDYTIQAKVIDKDGNVLSEGAEQSVKVKHGFLDKILFFFAYLLKLLLTPIWYLEGIL